MTTYLPTIVDRKYGPRGDLSHDVVEVCDVYYPDETRWVKPDGGWAFVVIHLLSGFIASSKPTSITSSNTIPHDLLERGIAVVLTRLPVARGGATPNDVSGGTYGDAYLGNGCFIPPSGNPGPGSVPPGYSGTHPWSDDDWLMPEKSACDIIQHLRYNATVLDLDPTRAGVWGSSSGAISAMMPVFGFDRADATSSTLQRRESTRYQVAWLEQGAGAWTVYDQTDHVHGYHFPVTNPDTSSPYDLWDWDEPCDRVGETLAQYQLLGAPYYYGTQDTWTPGLTALNQAGNVGLEYFDAMDAGLLATANRYTSIPSNVETEVHSVYGGYLLKAKFTTGVTLYLSSLAIQDATAASNGGVAEDYIIEDDEDRHTAKINFLVNGLGGSPEVYSETHYADVEDDVFPIIKRLGQDVGSAYPLVTTAEATQILVSVEAQIDTALDAYGLTVPITSPTHFVYTLRLIAAWGAAYHIVESYMLNDPSPGLQEIADFWRSQYDAGIESLRDGTGIPRSIASPVVGRPASHLSDYPDADPDLGVQANPYFVRGKDW